MPRGHMHVLGLDIGRKAIKAVELRRTGSGIELMGLPVVWPTPERSVEGGVIVDTAAVGGALTELISAGGFHTRKTVVSVGGDSSVVVRITEVPKMTGKELEEAIQWELDRQTPFPIDQTIYDYQPLKPADADPNAQNMEVLIAVAQEDMINAHIDAIQAAKLIPAAVDVEPLAIARALVDAAGGALMDQTVSIVHMGASLTTIMVVRKGLLSFVRSIPTAGDALTQAIQQNFMGDERLSEQVKRAFADLSEALYGEGAPAPAPRAGTFNDDVLGEEEMDSVFELSDAGTSLLPTDQPLSDEAGATQLEVAPPSAAQMPAAAATPPARPNSARAQPSEPVIDGGMNTPATSSTSPSTNTTPRPARSHPGRNWWSSMCRPCSSSSVS
jgi:type IV pilus assembly protein PilM